MHLKQVIGLMVVVLFFSVLLPMGTSASQNSIDVQYDSQDDLLIAKNSGALVKGTGHDYLDIQELEIIEDTGNALPVDDELHFKITVGANIPSDSDVQYIILISSNIGDYVAQWTANQITAQGSKLGSGASTTPQGIKIEQSGNTVTFQFMENAQLSGITHSSITWNAISTEEVSDGRYLDLAPDKLVLLTSHSEYESVFGSITISGITRPMTNPLTSVEYQIDSGAWTSATSTNSWSTWSFLWDTTSVSNGEHAINIRAQAGSDSFTDSMKINVQQSYSTQSSRPSLDSLTAVAVGDHFEYEDVGTQQLLAISVLPINDMSIDITAIESLTTSAGTFDSYRFEIHQEGELDLGVDKVITTTDRTSWRKQTDLAILKDETHSVTEGTTLIPTTTVDSESIYSNPEPENEFPMVVMDTWTISGNVVKEITMKEENQPPSTTTATDSRTVKSLVLYEQSSTSTPKGSYTTMVVKHEEGDTGFYTLEYYNENVAVPVLIEIYDYDRNLIAALGLSEVGTIDIVVDIDVNPTSPEDGEEAVVTITVTNNGNVAMPQPIEFTLYDDDVLVETVTIPAVAAGASRTEVIDWTPSGEGDHSLTVSSKYGTTAPQTVAVQPEGGDPPPAMSELLLPVALLVIVLIVVLVLVMVTKNRKLVHEIEHEMDEEARTKATPKPKTSGVVSKGGVTIASGEAAAATSSGDGDAIVITDDEPELDGNVDIDSKVDAMLGEGDGGQPSKKQKAAPSKPTEIKCPNCSKGSFMTVTKKPMLFVCPFCNERYKLE